MSGATLAGAYSATGRAWQQGPGRIYDRLAEAIVAVSPLDLAGRRILDLGAGTGAASRAIRAAGGEPIAADVALGMLRSIESGGPRVVADARGLPFAARSLDGVVAAFSINHLTDPAPAVRDARRVVRTGGVLLVSAYAADDSHPVKEAVDTAAAEHGWVPARWLQELRERAIPVLSTVDGAAAVAAAAGLQHATVQRRDVHLADLDVDDLIAWRCGMAQLAPFVAELPAAERDHLRRRAAELLGDPPPLVRRMVLITAVV